ncbi:MAG: hypothetical protein ACOYME_14275 [Prochlorotrichaceae cyanobacterium]|jgi:hypothetical protein
MNDRFSQAITLLLTANTFFVFASFAWFLIALLGRSFNLSWGLDVWYSLWQPLFSPAIGLLMGGVILGSLGRWIGTQWQAFRQKIQKN